MDLHTPQIRSAATGDVPQILSLLKPFVTMQALLPRTPGEIHKLSENGFVAELGSELIGFAAIEIYSSKLAEIQCLAVAEQHQKQGLGQQLVQRCVELARENDIIELMAITASEQLFRFCGFDYSLPNQKRALFIHPN